ncbi:hypothetical protein BT63DRAFT_450227 [Microthyrium microscopicum]|uniref:Uncharacterized protein n=1 Tax=Microthyrium microscopicum TaxID=703497 RepID=A0A6A6USZ4_9PEZI|nr:hypothetical protein BT63DRAFT_450227 [Microthyrium microscopicum]
MCPRATRLRIESIDRGDKKKKRLGYVGLIIKEYEKRKESLVKLLGKTEDMQDRKSVSTSPSNNPRIRYIKPVAYPTTRSSAAVSEISPVRVARVHTLDIILNEKRLKTLRRVSIGGIHLAQCKIDDNRCRSLGRIWWLEKAKEVLETMQTCRSSFPHIYEKWLEP